MKDLLVFVADGFEEIELITIVDLVRRVGLSADIVSMTGRCALNGAHGIVLEADVLFDAINPAAYRAYFVPGGMPGASHLRDDRRVTETVKQAYNAGREIFAICAAPIVLEAAGILEGKRGTSYPGFKEDLSLASYEERIYVMDNGVHTSRGPATAMLFAIHMIEVLKGAAAAAQLREDLLLDWMTAEVKAGRVDG